MLIIILNVMICRRKKEEKKRKKSFHFSFTDLCLMFQVWQATKKKRTFKIHIHHADDDENSGIN